MKFGAIGFGNMGGAIVKGAVASGVLAKEDVLVYDIKGVGAESGGGVRPEGGEGR